MPAMYWLPIAGVVLLLVYEIWVVFGGGGAKGYLSLSGIVWKWMKRYPVVPFGFGLLMGHFFL